MKLVLLIIFNYIQIVKCPFFLKHVIFVKQSHKLPLILYLQLTTIVHMPKRYINWNTYSSFQCWSTK